MEDVRSVINMMILMRHDCITGGVFFVGKTPGYLIGVDLKRSRMLG